MLILLDLPGCGVCSECLQHLYILFAYFNVLPYNFSGCRNTCCHNIAKLITMYFYWLILQTCTGVLISP